MKDFIIRDQDGTVWLIRRIPVYSTFWLDYGNGGELSSEWSAKTVDEEELNEEV